jgi:hypothetical protein
MHLKAKGMKLDCLKEEILARQGPRKKWDPNLEHDLPTSIVAANKTKCAFGETFRKLCSQSVGTRDQCSLER